MNVMLDLETLGTAPGSVILSLGAVVFSPNLLPEDWPSIYRVINIDSCREAGLTVDQSTLQWWYRQSSEARQVLYEAKDITKSSTLSSALVDFCTFLRQNIPDPAKTRLWGNGSDFDNVLLCCAFKACKLNPPWKYHGHRCFRTLKNLFPAYDEQFKPSVTAHNALTDARDQAIVANAILQHIQP